MNKYKRLKEDPSQIQQFGDEVVNNINNNASHIDTIEQTLPTKANLVGGKVPSEELPSYVDDVVEYASLEQFPAEGEAGKIYVADDTGATYRWSGSDYIKVGAGDLMLSITYDDLKTLRDAGELTPGMQYRIIDYTCTTSTFLTHSAGHVFDIIVVADNETTLNKKARAVQHEGDTYFANSDLATWQLWYDLDNDQTKYAWADPVNGKGVIFRMIDEFNNDVPYDFKNIIYEDRIGFTYTQWGINYVFTRDSSLDADGCYGWRTANMPAAWSNPYCFTTVETPSTSMTLYSNTSGSTISFGGSIILVSIESNDWYTFTVSGTDGSLIKSNNIHDNVMKPWESGLNRNVFKSRDCYSNTFESDCYSNTFGYSCYSNEFGDSCYYNTFGKNCYSNAFGRNCYSNTFKNYCCFNTFKNDCYNIEFLDNCCSNIFRSECDFNTFSSFCSNNTFGNSCSANTFTSNCTSNIFEDYCSSITLQSSASGTYLKNVHVHAGVKGTNSTPLVIDVPVKDQAYSIDYYAAGSQEIILGGNE